MKSGGKELINIKSLKKIANKLDIKFIKIYGTVFKGKTVENLFAYFPKDVDGEVHYSPKGYQK